MQDHILIHRPAKAAELILMFHGVGSRPEDLEPLGQALAVQFPAACIVSLRSPDASDLGHGWQWFSVQGITEANRPARVAATMPRFVQTVQKWQRETGVDATATTLLGFSQGAIMALESTQQAVPLAARVIAIAGRFAQPPRTAPASTRIHLLHGNADKVMPIRLAEEAMATLSTMGASITLDRFPGLGHSIDDRVLDRLSERMRY